MRVYDIGSNVLLKTFYRRLKIRPEGSQPLTDNKEGIIIIIIGSSRIEEEVSFEAFSNYIDFQKCV